MSHPITPKLTTVQSSNVHSLHFCPDCSSWYVRFLVGAEAGPLLYKFAGSADEKAELDKLIADKGSVGGWFHKTLKPREFKKLEA